MRISIGLAVCLLGTVVSFVQLEAQPRGKAVSEKDAASKPAVLLVIANQDFFYREYSDPREELEKAGLRVVVAAGAKTLCRPHAGTGEGSDQGLVTPDVALSEVKAKDYQAIVFAGGWGASMYQPAFSGQYATAAYNGDRRTKEAVNKLVGEFLAQDKQVAGICHGVSVLAWSRVKGESVLKGKTVCAPPIQGPPMRLAGQAQQPPSRWNSEANGAKVLPSRSVGDKSTTRDDVSIDGLIITAEDDQSARECGRLLAERLLQRR